MKKNILTIALFFIFNSSFSQTSLLGPTISYQSQSGNMFKIGGYFLRNTKTDFTFKIDATANMAYFRDKFTVIPEAGFTYFIKPNDIISTTLEAEISPYTFTPKVGLSIVTIIDFSIGYGIETHTKSDLKPIKGFTFSLGISFPINMF